MKTLCSSRHLVVVILMTFVLTSCGDSIAVQITSTPLPPTSTPLPPTSTPLPLTPTPTTGEIVGTISIPEGHTLLNETKISLSMPDASTATQERRVDPKGSFSFDEIKPGKYKIFLTLGFVSDTYCTNYSLDYPEKSGSWLSFNGKNEKGEFWVITQMHDSLDISAGNIYKADFKISCST